LKIIAAVAVDGAIGKDNKLLWYIPEDLQKYKEKTLDNICICGLNTYYSLPAVALMGRIHIVVSDDDSIEIDVPNGANVHCMIGLESAMDLAEEIRKDLQEIYIIGGAKMYESTIDLVDELEITWVDKLNPEADVFFPVIKLNEQFELQDIGTDWETSKEGLDYKYAYYKRIKHGN